MQQRKGFFGSLFDFTFQSFATPTLVPVLYGLSLAVIGLYALFLLVAAFSASSAAGVFVLIIGDPLFIIISLIYVRVLMEFLIVVFRIEEHTGVTAAGGGGGGQPGGYGGQPGGWSPPPPPPPPPPFGPDPGPPSGP